MNAARNSNPTTPDPITLAASALGRRGGAVKSERKAATSRANGRLASEVMRFVDDGPPEGMTGVLAVFGGSTRILSRPDPKTPQTALYGVWRVTAVFPSGRRRVKRVPLDEARAWLRVHWPDVWPRLE